MSAAPRCSCGCFGPLVSTDPDGRHWHEETPGAFTTRPPDQAPQQLLDQAAASLARLRAAEKENEA